MTLFEEKNLNSMNCLHEITHFVEDLAKKVNKFQRKFSWLTAAVNRENTEYDMIVIEHKKKPQ